MSAEPSDKLSKRRAQNRVAQQNYRKNLRKRIEDLESVNNILVENNLRLNPESSSASTTNPPLATSPLQGSPPSIGSSPSHPYPLELYDRKNSEQRNWITSQSPPIQSPPIRSPATDDDRYHNPQTPVLAPASSHSQHSSSASYFPPFDETQSLVHSGSALLHIQPVNPSQSPLPHGYQTPLHQAVLSGHVQMAQLLLRNGADVNAIDHQGKAPLHVAALAGQTSCIHVLLDAGALVELRDSMGMTALQLAASMNQVSAAEALLASGAHVNVGSVWPSKTP